MKTEISTNTSPLKIKWIILGCAIFLAQTSNAQFIYNSAFGLGTFGSDRIHDLRFDAAGNSYVIGEFTGTVDFDPGPGIQNRTAGSAPSIFFEKFDVSGTLLWVQVIQRATTSWAYTNLDIAVDGAGDVFIAGNFDFTVDFNPGTGVNNLTSTGNLDIFLAKYSSSTGSYIFAEKFNSLNNDHLYKIGTDAAGSVAVSMVVTGPGIDLDPGVGVATYGVLACNLFLAKYNNSGAYLWSQLVSTTTPAWNGILDMKLDLAGDIYLTGILAAANDFDPSAGVLMLSPVGALDAFIVKYTGATGGLVWGKSIGGPGDDLGMALAIDQTNSIVHWGTTFHNTVDFNPGTGVTNLTSNGNYDIGFGCYSATTGNMIWAKSAGGTGDDVPRTITMDLCENIYVGGDVASSSIDLDPSAGVANFTTAGMADIFVSKYTSMGCYLNAFVLGGPNNDYNWVSNYCFPLNQLFVGGEFRNTVDFNPGSGVANLVSAGGTDGYIARYSETAFVMPPPTSTTPLINLTLTSCTPLSTTLVALSNYTSACSSTTTSTLYWYDASTGGILLGSGSSYTTPALPVGTTTFYVMDSTCSGKSIRVPITVTVTAGISPSITVAGVLSICSGNTTTLTATGLSTYTWSPSGSLSSTSSYSVIASPSVTTSYTIMAGSAGCFTQTIVNVIVNTTPTVSIIASANSVCVGQPALLMGSGATTYLWFPSSSSLSSSSGGTTTASPSSTSTYTLTGSTGTCTSSAVTTISVIPTPTITVTSATICAGQTANLTAIGATSYTWSTGQTSSSVMYTPSTTASYTVTGANGGVCSANAIANIVVINYPVINTSNVSNVHCFGVSDGSITINATGASTYNWLPSVSTSSIATGLAAGIYACILSTGPSCSVISTYTITQPTALAGSITGTNTTCGLCNGIATASASGGTLPYTYAWSPSAGTQTIASDLCSNTYSVFIKDSNNCISICSVSIAPSVPFIASVMASNTEIFQGEAVSLIATEGVTYTWTPATSLSCINCANTIAKPTDDITYCVDVTSVDNCNGSACIEILIKCGDLFVPTAFSPNGDGHNDELAIYGNCINDVVFRIYDRWGEMVYESFDPTEKWDGNYKGNAVNAGVFVYQFSGKVKSGEYLTKKGNITVVK